MTRITQAMIDAYDEYTHLTLDRRKFMEKLTRLAGSGAAAAAIAPLLSANMARASIIAADDARIKSEDVAFAGGAAEMRGYLARPADATGPLPGVVIIHENRGLNAHIKDVARRFALEGFLALAPDFLAPYGGTPADEDKARQMFTTLDPARTVADAVASAAFLRSHEAGNGKVGAVGFCWGGGMVNMLAVNDPDLGAAVAYYGVQPKDPADIAAIKAPLMLHYAGLDERINAGIEAYKGELDAAGKDYQLFIYEGKQHAFSNDTSEARYDKEAADLAWGRTVGFLKDALT